MLLTTKERLHNYMDPLAVKIIGDLAVLAIISLASFIGGRVFPRIYSPLAKVPRTMLRHAFQYLDGDWKEYHITNDTLLHASGPYWLQDTWKMKVRSGNTISGTLEIPRPGEVAEYRLLGEIRMGGLIITGSSVQDPLDFFTVIFPELIGKGQHPLVGTMTAYDWNGKLYTGPMILSRSDMSLDKLTETMVTAKPTDFYAAPKLDWLCTSISPEFAPATS